MNVFRINNPWAITQEGFESFLLNVKGSLQKEAKIEIESKMLSNAIEPTMVTPSLAVVPIQGVIDYKPDPFVAYFYGLTDVTEIQKSIKSLAGQEDVKTIVLAIDSPGGNSLGVKELADTILEVRSQKRVIAVADPLAASAGYWIASAASAVYAAPSSLVGSIGAYLLHVERSKMLDEIGIKPTFIYRGEKKVDGNGLEPLSDRAKTDFQSMIDEVYDDFVNSVAKGRGIPVQSVIDGYGRGGVLSAKRAIQEGMIDDIISTEDLILSEMKSISESLQYRAHLELEKLKITIQEIN